MLKKFQKIIAAGLCTLLTISAAPTLNTIFDSSFNTMTVSAIDNNIGSGLSWSLSDNNKTLTISGSGNMIDFVSASAVPWRGKSSDITKVVFSNGVKNIGAFAFAYCTSLEVISIPDTIEKIGSNAFYNSGLQIVDFNMTNRVIDESAFRNTPYYKNYYTIANADTKNIGAANKLSGRQLVVNVFVNELSGQFSYSDCTKLDHTDTVDSSECYVIKDDKPGYNFYKLPKSAVKYRYTSSFGAENDATKVSEYSTSTNADAISLDDYKYYDKYIYNSKSEYQSNKSSKYVGSDKMKEVLNTVDIALEDLKNQAKEYGKTVEFVSSPDTNFFFTYNRWNDAVKPNAWDGCIYTPNLSSSIKNAYIIGNEETVYRKNANMLSTNNLFAQFNNKIKQKMNMDISIDPNNDKFTSTYTDYLKTKYNANGVIYLFHFNCGAIGTVSGMAHVLSKTTTGSTGEIADEKCQIYNEDATTIEHEICHLYGAPDYYDTNAPLLSISPKVSTDPYYAYTYSYYNREIMMGGVSGSKIGADTAYFIGLSDNIMKDAFDVLTKNKKYQMGDVNMDGVVNTIDSTLISKYNTYKEYPTKDTVLTPIQKVIGGIVKP